MKKLSSLLAAGLALSATCATAAAVGWETGTVTEIRTVIGSTQVEFSLSGERVHNGCSGDDSFFFDATTSSGKSAFSALLSAKASGKPVNIWINTRRSGPTPAPCVHNGWNVTVIDIAP